MTAAALLDVGADINSITKHLHSLKEHGKKLGISLKKWNVKLKGLKAARFDVLTNENHFHARSFPQIKEIISKSSFDTRTKSMAIKIFNVLARAESRVHGRKVNDSMLHEAGSNDSIIDILSSAALIKSLGIKRIVFSALPLGSGHVRCAHGILPLPAPAALEIIRKNKIPVYGVKCGRETVTPTGAAITAALAGSFGAMPDMKIEKTGTGAGSLSKEPADVLRIFVGRTIRRK